MTSIATSIPNHIGQRVVRHAEYYIHGGDVIFRVSYFMCTVLVIDNGPSTG
jgi:hypothetical protein